MIRDFASYLVDERHREERTVRFYVTDLDQFATFIFSRDNAKHFYDASTEDIQAFIDHLCEKNYKAGTISRKVAALSTFFQWAIMAGHIKENPIKHGRRRYCANLSVPKIPERERRVMTVDESHNLFRSITGNDEWTRSRDRVLVLLMTRYGLRASELQTVAIGDIDRVFKSIKIHRQHTRGCRREMIVNLGDDFHYLEDYLAKTQSKRAAENKIMLSGNFLFTNKFGTLISLRSIRRRIALTAKKAGLKNVNPSALRHTFAVKSLAQGTPVADVKERLGHASLATTKAYLNAVEAPPVVEVPEPPSQTITAPPATKPVLV